MADPIPYVEESSAELDEAADKFCDYTWLPDPIHPRSVDVRGCPVCMHDTTYKYILKIVAGIGEGVRGDDNLPVRVPARCQCTVEHPGSNGAKGCGRRFAIHAYKVPQ